MENKRQMKWVRITEVHEYGYHEQPDGKRQEYDHINHYRTKFETKQRAANTLILATYHDTGRDCNGRRYARHFVVLKSTIERLDDPDYIFRSTIEKISKTLSSLLPKVDEMAVSRQNAFDSLTKSQQETTTGLTMEATMDNLYLLRNNLEDACRHANAILTDNGAHHD